MLPNIEDHQNTITVKKDEIYFCVDLDMKSAKNFTKVVVRQLNNRNKIGRYCAECIFFHGNIMKRVPYDTKILHFLKHWLNVDKE